MTHKRKEAGSSTVHEYMIWTNLLFLHFISYLLTDYLFCASLSHRQSSHRLRNLETWAWAHSGDLDNVSDNMGCYHTMGQHHWVHRSRNQACPGPLGWSVVAIWGCVLVFFHNWNTFCIGIWFTDHCQSQTLHCTDSTEIWRLYNCQLYIIGHCHYTFMIIVIDNNWLSTIDFFN